MVHPADNPLSVATIDLGRKLFHDTRLSADGTISCGSCHNPLQGYTQTNMPTPVGIGGRRGDRNAPSLFDVGYRTTMFHDGRAATLEAQYRSPMLGPSEMGNASMDAVVDRIKGFDDYRTFFAYAFAAEPSTDTLGKALANYQRALVTGPNRFDRWHFGKEPNALAAQEIEGFRVFERARCGACHVVGASSAEFTDDGFRKNGYARMRADAGATDLGRAMVTRRTQDRFAFRTPTLRNVALTRPYMHDGGLATLADVVAFYGNTGLRSIAAPGAPLSLSADEQMKLVAFLDALTSPTRP
jgi:cytochrome c peroxidase